MAINNGDDTVSFHDSDFSLIDGGAQVTSGVIFGKVDPDFSSCSARRGGVCEGWWTTMIWDRLEVRDSLVFR